MRNLKKLLAVVVAICMLATFTVTAFAADEAVAKTDAQIAEGLGVIQGQGNGVTADYLASTPTRIQGAIMFLRLKGLETAAKAFTGSDNFADVAGLNDTNKAILAYLKATPDLGFEGVGDNNFAPTKEMTAKEYYKIMLVALGYDYGTDFTWANVFSFAASKGLTKLIDNEKFTVDALCIGTVEALQATVKGGTDTLIAALVDGNSIAADKALASGIYTATAKALEVVSTSADNLVIGKIVFNKELNKDTVTAANIYNGSTAYLPVLGPDNKTVYIALAGPVASQDTAIEFTIKGVKDTSGVTITEVKKTITFRDVTIPTINGVFAKNAKTLVIAASEPMNYIVGPMPLASIKVDGVVVYGTTAIDLATNTIIANLYSNLTTGTHKVDIADLTDFAGYKAVAQSFNVDVVEDKTAPVLTSAKMNNSKEIEATFSEDLGLAGTFTVEGYTVTNVSAPDGAKVKISLSAPLGIGAIVEVKLGYKGQKDVMGNEVTTTGYYTFKVEDDTVLPTVAATIDAATNNITLTFSKPMTSTGTITLFAADGTTQLATPISVVDGTFDSTSNKTVIKLGNIIGVDAMDIIVNIKDMKDASVRTNALAEQKIALKFADTNAPTVLPFYTVTPNADPTKDYVTFYFNEAMNLDSIKSLSNYVMTSGGALSAVGASLKEVNATNVSFYVPGIAAGIYAGTDFTVYAVKDAAGNMKATSTVDPLGSGTPFTVNYANATAKNKIEIGFDGTIGALDYTAFVVKKGAGSVVYVKSITQVSTTKASIELWSNLDASTSGVSIEIAASKIKDAYGASLITTTSPVIDKIKATGAVAALTSSGAIAIAFDELIDGSVVNTGATTIGGLAGILTLYKDGIVDLTTTATTITFLNGTTPVAAGEDFTAIMIQGLSAATTYSVVVNPTLYDLATPANAINFINTTVKTN